MRKKKRVRNHRVGITLLLSGLVFAFLTVSLVIADAITIFLVNEGVLHFDTSVPSLFRLGMDIALFSVLIGVILAFTAGRLPMMPVNKVINCLNRVASGDYSTRLTYKGILGRLPAIREMTESFNKMAEEIENTEVLRSDFINNFSHEFKTPIVSIAGFAKLLKLGQLTEEERMEYINIIEEESLRLSGLATNMLNLTKVENQTILTHVSEYNLSEQLRKCILLLENRWEKKQLDLHPDFEEYQIMANEELLEQVWLNLIDNAVKFADEGGLLEIGVREEAEMLTVEVTNSGSSITEDQRELIFGKFYQADTSHAASGNGVGLAIVKKVVELHHGQIQVSSTENMTRFTVSLPKRQPE